MITNELMLSHHELALPWFLATLHELNRNLNAQKRNSCRRQFTKVPFNSRNSVAIHCVFSAWDNTHFTYLFFLFRNGVLTILMGGVTFCVQRCNVPSSVTFSPSIQKSCGVCSVIVALSNGNRKNCFFSMGLSIPTKKIRKKLKNNLILFQRLSLPKLLTAKRYKWGFLS